MARWIIEPTDPRAQDADEGDFWLNSASLKLFGPKEKREWPYLFSLDAVGKPSGKAQAITQDAILSALGFSSREEMLEKLKGEKGASYIGRGVRGFSAYEIAQQNGFEGTEEEWLASLQGSAGGSLLTKIAGEDISALLAVFISAGSAFKADKDALAEASGIVGVTTTAALSGEAVSVQIEGEMTDASWSWSVSPSPNIYLGSNGALTQTAPTAGYLVRVGVATSATSMRINPGEPIALA